MAGGLQLYVGVDSRPVLSDPSTYVMAMSIDNSSTFRPPPIYLPPSICALGDVCSVFVTVVTSAVSSFVSLTPAISAGSTWLMESQKFNTLNASRRHTAYQFSLSSTPQTVTVSVQSSSIIDVACSYQYVTPDTSNYDWITSQSPATFDLNQETTLTFQWTSALQVNPSTALSSSSSTCYCSVLPTNVSAAYSIVFMSTRSSSLSSGLSGGELAAVIVVPVVCAAALAGVLWWAWREGGGCRRWMDGRKHQGSHGKSWTRQEDRVSSDLSAVAMADLHPSSRTMLNQRWDSSA